MEPTSNGQILLSKVDQQTASNDEKHQNHSVLAHRTPKER